LESLVRIHAFKDQQNINNIG
jgi:hypothetical protein